MYFYTFVIINRLFCYQYILLSKIIFVIIVLNWFLVKSDQACLSSMYNCYCHHRDQHQTAMVEWGLDSLRKGGANTKTVCVGVSSCLPLANCLLCLLYLYLYFVRHCFELFSLEDCPPMSFVHLYVRLGLPF